MTPASNVRRNSRTEGGSARCDTHCVLVTPSRSRNGSAVSAQRYIGPYRHLNLVRSGKTCDVWEVMDDAKSERLAIKLLEGDAAKVREEVAFLKHERQVGVSLDHPNVIKIYRFRRDGEYVYLSMELFAAPTSSNGFSKGSSRWRRCCPTCIEQAAEGLAYFHEQGWIHRDVKPDNFLMKQDGEVKLIDFALARRRRGPGQVVRRQVEDPRHAQLHVARADSRPGARPAGRHLQFWLHGL